MIIDNYLCSFDLSERYDEEMLNTTASRFNKHHMIDELSLKLRRFVLFTQYNWFEEVIGYSDVDLKATHSQHTRRIIEAGQRT